MVSAQGFDPCSSSSILLSPANFYNPRRYYTMDPIEPETKKCATCKRVLPISDFYRCGHTKGGKIRRANECISCRRKREKIRYDEQQMELFKSKKSCIHCGLNKPYLLEFHHRDQSEKEFTIAHWRKRSRDALLCEIEKCDTLCKNCHAEFHYLSKNQGISYEEYLKNYPSQ